MNEILQSELQPGTALSGGKYVIEKKIGSGGFGITYLAKHSTLEKLYAIKEFFLNGFNVRNNTSNHVGLSGIEAKDFNKFRQRFIDEARTLAKLNHDAVVKVLDIFEENGTSYMVMPFIQGTTLQNMVEDHGPMEYEMAVNYIVQICDALSYVHSKGILHRDVTPDNVIVKPDQKIVLIDFGSARKFTNDMTQRHTTIVKQGYAPMEQYSAKSRKGAYTDLYSLGAVFYFLLTGERPMDATERSISKMKEPIELNSHVPEQINAVIMKAMEMDINNRYQTADDMSQDIMSGNFPQSSPQEQSASQALSFSENEEKLANDENKKLKKQKTKKKIKADLQDTQHLKKPNQEESPLPKGKNLLKAIAIAISAIAIVLVVLVLRQTNQNAENQQEEIIDSGMVVDLTQLSELSNENCNTIMDRVFDDTNNPIALFAIAQKADHDTISDSMVEYWEQYLLPNGDVDKHIINDKEFEPARFAFVCAARAYENCDNYQFKSPAEKDLFIDTLTHFLERIKKLAPDNLSYEEHE